MTALEPGWQFLAEVRVAAARLAPVAPGGPSSDGATVPRDAVGSPAGPIAADAGDPTLNALVEVFGLSLFERAILVLAAGIELDGGTAAAVRDAHGQPFLTFSLALASLPEPHWSALAPTAPLRRWRLVEPEPGPSLTVARLRIDERVLHLLAGVAYRDPRLAGLVETLEPPTLLPPSQTAIAERLGAILAGSASPRVHLGGPDLGRAPAVAAAGCAVAGRGAVRVRATDLPRLPAERTTLQRLWERESVLEGCVLVVEVDDEVDRTLRDIVARFVRGLDAPCVIVSREALAGLDEAIRIELPRAPAPERRALWRDALGPAWVGRLDGQLDAVVAQFDLDPPAVAAAARDADAVSYDDDRLSADDAAERLWAACRVRARPRLDDLAERIVSAAAWDDLVLPDTALEALRALAGQVRGRARVYEDWGFAARGSRGLGVSALFAGPSGTGKTMAAEVLANELRLDLYRIDLSAVVSKYIGETEKNLRRVFDAADQGGALLVFDEADALFGRRTDVRDSHDRFANIEVSYLLQRMEAYRGLAVLTTNRRDALDDAFLRRIRFVIEFPFPDAMQRAEIWQRAFPVDVPRGPLDLDALAGLTVAGGNIRNIALGAAFLAADEAGLVTMGHLRRAARTEYAKLERPLSSVELAG